VRTKEATGARQLSSLESENDVALARDWIRLFAVDSAVVVVPEDVWLRGRGAGGRAEGIALVLGLGDNAAHWAARFRCEGHSENNPRKTVHPVVVVVVLS
jgi:hypothetical protein